MTPGLPTLPTRPLGMCGLCVSVVGLGTVKLGRTAGLKHPGTLELPSDERALALLSRARDLGITLIDTAPAYGVSEQRLGGLMPRVAPRERWVISTKVGEEFDQASATSRYDFTPEHTRRSVERSLTRLRTDRLDIVLVHSGGDDHAIIRGMGTLDALAELRSAGKVRAIGMSTKTLAGALAAVERCDVVMVTLNPRDRADLPALEAASRRGVGVLVKKALLSGHVGEVPSLLADRPELAAMARADPAGACVRFAAQAHGVSSVIIGTTSPEHLEHAVLAATTP